MSKFKNRLPKNGHENKSLTIFGQKEGYLTSFWSRKILNFPNKW
ncbi:hypothetical protein [Virgibacillus kimchii]